MIALDGKEAYALFLESDFWKELSLECRQAAGFKCQRCGMQGRSRTQAHHRRYPEHWFDTRVEDLECVCRKCHLQEHGIMVELKVIVVVEDRGVGQWTQAGLEQARSKRQISRPVYLKIRAENGWAPVKRLKPPKRVKVNGQPPVRSTRAERRDPGWWPGMYEGVPLGGRPPGQFVWAQPLSQRKPKKKKRKKR